MDDDYDASIRRRFKLDPKSAWQKRLDVLTTNQQAELERLKDLKRRFHLDMSEAEMLEKVERLP